MVVYGVLYIFAPYFLGHSLHWLMHRGNGWYKLYVTMGNGWYKLYVTMGNGWYKLYVTMGNGSFLGVKQLGRVLASHPHRARRLKKE